MTRYPLALLLALLLTACATAPAPEPEYYRLSVPAQAAGPARALAAGTITVAPFRAEGVLRERAIAFVAADDGGPLRQHHYHYWSESLPRLLQDELVEFLRARRAASFVSTDTTIASNLEIRAQVLHFERVLQGERCSVAVAIEIELRRTQASTPLLLEVYRVELPVADLSMPASVSAFSSAVGTVYSRFFEAAQGVLRSAQEAGVTAAGQFRG